MGFLKKEKKKRGPEFYASETKMPLLNYNEYYMKKLEWFLYAVISLAIGALVGYIFYGGIGLNNHGEPTTLTYVTNTIAMVIFGVIAYCILMPMRRKQLQSKRKDTLRRQFVDMLESLSVSISAGQNVPNAMQNAKKDLLIQYNENDYIVKELDTMLKEMANGIQIEDLLHNFGMRSGIEDISNFGKIFEVSYRRGGDMKAIIKSCYEILSEKIETELEIKTKVTSSANQMNIMICLPILLIAVMKSSGGSFAENFASATGIISTTVALIIFLVSYLVGRRILNIRA